MFLYTIYSASIIIFILCFDCVHVQVAYFGPTNKVVEYFANLGLHCSLHYNPADYIRKYHYVRKHLCANVALC